MNRYVLLALILLVACFPLAGSAVTLPGVCTATTGTVISASNWNTCVTAIQTELTTVQTGGIRITGQMIGDLLTANSATTYGRIPAVGTGQVLASQGAATAPAWTASPTLTALTLSGATVGGVIDRDVTALAVGNTVTETTVYSFTVPGGTLSTNRALRLTLTGTYLKNVGTSSLFTTRVKFGGTTIATFVQGSFAQGATSRALLHVTTLSAANATDAQVAASENSIGALGTGEATAGAYDYHWVSVNGAVAVDSAVNQSLVVTFQHGAADASISASALVVQLEVLR